MNALKLSVSLISILVCSFLISGCSKSESNNATVTDAGTATIFTEITDQAGLNFVHDPAEDGSHFMPESAGAGGAFLDYDNDGDLDIYFTNGARHGENANVSPPLRNRLFRQEADGSFVDVTDASGSGDTGYGMGVAVGDIDNDGDVDIYISNYELDALYRNNGDGTFTNITTSAGIDNRLWGSSVVFFDYDLDGFLDIYVTNYVAYNPARVCTDRAGRREYCGPASFPGVTDVLYHNNGDGTFSNVSAAAGIAGFSLKGLGVIAADLNGDAYPELYVANDGEPNLLWINQQDGTFQNQALAMGSAVNGIGVAEASMGIALGDIDNDEDLDLFMTHLRNESNTLYRNTATYGFQDDTFPTGLAAPSMSYTGFGTGFFDYDHDGDLDLAVVNGRVARGPLLTDRKPPLYWDYYAEPNLLFENDEMKRFRDVSHLGGSFCSAIETSRGLAFGDVDNDGDLDILVINDGGPARLFRNDMENKGHWLTIRAIDPALQRDAIGARITVTAGEKRLLRLIAPGYSYLSSNDPRAHFGLAAADKVDEIFVRWPDGQTERFPGVAADQIITLRKGQSRQSQ